MTNARAIVDADYRRLLMVRTGLRQFERWSADQAAAQGLTGTQHQLLLAIRGHEEKPGPTIGQIADYLLIRHHSAVELIDRTERAGLIGRFRDEDDRRVVRLRLEPRGADILESLTSAHLEELGRLEPLFNTLIGTLAEQQVAN